jgi:putative aldouronate transport system permease protein
LRTFINTTIPDSLLEAAEIDGANDFRVYWQIVLPLFKAGLATIALFNVVSRWNNWFSGMLYIEDSKLIPLQTMLQKIQRNVEFIKNNADVTQEERELLRNMPTESVRMAITVITTVPILFAYPFFQRYFITGMTIGSVKG